MFNLQDLAGKNWYDLDVGHLNDDGEGWISLNESASDLDEAEEGEEFEVKGQLKQ
jgi:hypothetical protein